MFPEPEPNLLLSGIINKLAHLRFRPLLPEAFDHVVLKAERARETRELFHAVERALASVQIFPD